MEQHDFIRQLGLSISVDSNSSLVIRIFIKQHRVGRRAAASWMSPHQKKLHTAPLEKRNPGAEQRLAAAWLATLILNETVQVEQ